MYPQPLSASSTQQSPPKKVDPAAAFAIVPLKSHLRQTKNSTFTLRSFNKPGQEIFSTETFQNRHQSKLYVTGSFDKSRRFHLHVYQCSSQYHPGVLKGRDIGFKNTDTGEITKAHFSPFDSASKSVSVSAFLSHGEYEILLGNQIP